MNRTARDGIASTVEEPASRTRLSFVVPTLNSAATLDAALYSLLSQQGVDVRVVVADSGSTDGTLDICKRWNVPTIYVPPGNMYAAINAGLRDFETEWLGYLNSDDWLYPDSLGRLTALGDATGADIVYGSCDFSDAYGRFAFSLAAAGPRQLVSLFRLGIMGFAQPAALFRRRAYQEIGGFDEQFALAADGVFYLKAARAGVRFALLEGPPVASFRMHSTQLTQRNSGQMKSEVRAMRTLAGEAEPIRDFCALLGWRLGNLLQYLVRLLRNVASLRTNRPAQTQPTALHDEAG